MRGVRDEDIATSSPSAGPPRARSETFPRVVDSCDALFTFHRHRRPIAEHERRPERDAGPRIVAAHDRGRVVAAGEQARDRRACCVQHPAVGVGAQAPRCCRACSDRPPWRSRAASRCGRGRGWAAGADRRCGGRTRCRPCRTPRRPRRRQTDCAAARSRAAPPRRRRSCRRARRANPPRRDSRPRQRAAGGRSRAGRGRDRSAR